MGRYPINKEFFPYSKGEKAPCFVDIHGGGFDSKVKATTTQMMLESRVGYMRRQFGS